MASLEIDVSSAASGKGSARLRTKGRGHRDRTDGNDSELSRAPSTAQLPPARAR